MCSGTQALTSTVPGGVCLPRGLHPACRAEPFQHRTRAVVGDMRPSSDAVPRAASCSDSTPVDPARSPQFSNRLVTVSEDCRGVSSVADPDTCRVWNGECHHHRGAAGLRGNPAPVTSPKPTVRHSGYTRHHGLSISSASLSVICGTSITFISVVAKLMYRRSAVFDVVLRPR